MYAAIVDSSLHERDQLTTDELQHSTEHAVNKRILKGGKTNSDLNVLLKFSNSV